YLRVGEAAITGSLRDCFALKTCRQRACAETAVVMRRRCPSRSLIAVPRSRRLHLTPLELHPRLRGQTAWNWCGVDYVCFGKRVKSVRVGRANCTRWILLPVRA
ncbi:unnamed protein product, partial [Laminaria digitata]